MGFLSVLWLPIVLSAVIVFVASSITHMVLPYHHSDYKKLPDEAGMLSGLRGEALPRGVYVFPFCTHKEMKSPEVMDKYKRGPVGFMTIFPNQPPAMPKFLALWFVYCLIVSFLVGYLTGHTVEPGVHYLAVFRVAGSAAFLAYGIGNIPNGVWRGWPWSNVAKELFDGLIYALLTAGTFGWLWPR